MTPQPPASLPDPLEQAHLAMLRGHFDQARTVLEDLLAAEPANIEALDLRAMVIAKQTILLETARLQAGNLAPPIPQFPQASLPTGSLWTRPLPAPSSLRLTTTPDRKWPKPFLFVGCLLAGMAMSFLPGHHSHSGHYRHYGDLSVSAHIVFGLLGGLFLFLMMLRKTR